MMHVGGRSTHRHMTKFRFDEGFQARHAGIHLGEDGFRILNENLAVFRERHAAAVARHIARPTSNSDIPGYSLNLLKIKKSTGIPLPACRRAP